MAKKADFDHILVIRLSAMGDVAMTVPVLLALKSSHPQIKISLLTKPHFKPIFNGLEGVEIFTADVRSKHKGLWGLWKLYKVLKGKSITHVADLHNVLRSKILGLFFGLQGIPVKKINKGRLEKKALTRSKNKKIHPLLSTAERYCEVFLDLGFTFRFEEGYYLPPKALSKEMEGYIGIASKKRIGIAPFATYTSKMYRLDLMEEVIRKLISGGNTSILLFGGGEREIGQLKDLESKFGDDVQSVAGKIGFNEELALISNLDVMVAMDSGNGHLAANYGVPVVTLWGVTHPYAGFMPYGQPMENSLLPDRERFPLIPTSVYGNKCPEEYLEAINSIPPKTVANKVFGVLG